MHQHQTLPIARHSMQTCHVEWMEEVARLEEEEEEECWTFVIKFSSVSIRSSSNSCNRLCLFKRLDASTSIPLDDATESDARATATLPFSWPLDEGRSSDEQMSEMGDELRLSLPGVEMRLIPASFARCSNNGL